jgi:predicted nucleic acid-binding protein
MQTATRTQVAIIDGGPAGLLLSHILDRNSIDSIVLERQSRQHVLRRIRAGVLEAGTVDLLRAFGLGERMDREGHPHNGTAIAWEGGERFLIDTKKFTGKLMMAYGQTAITEDLYAARDAAGGETVDEAGNVQLHELASTCPYVTYEKNGQANRIDCDYGAGEDTQLLDKVLEDRQVVMVPVVLTELLSDPKLPTGVAETLSEVPLIEIQSGYWQRAGKLRAKVLAKRPKARLGDALIVQSCIDAGVPLLTRDRDFRAFAEAPRLSLVHPQIPA